MVVVSIVALLVAVILPAVVRTRDAAALTQCASNLHQLVTAANSYVAMSHGQYPPYLAATNPVQSWYDDDKVGAYLGVYRKPGATAALKGGVYVCPNDGPGTILMSYSINIWSSSKLDNTTYLSEVPKSAQFWSARTRYGSKMILLGEGYSATGSATLGFSAPIAIGGAYASSGAPLYTPVITMAGVRFGGMGGVLYTAGRFGKPGSELCFMRHRVLGMPGTWNQPKGRLNLAYADGHVASKTDTDLVNASGVSTGDSYWSPADFPPGN
jgi:prepilin-type processing-associated H-X9-DG protein